MGGFLLHTPWPSCGQSDVVVAQPVSSQEWLLLNESQNGEPTGVGSMSVSRADSGDARLGEARRLVEEEWLANEAQNGEPTGVGSMSV